ncbi:MAG: hypothetical protein DSM106950_39045 [Stigonema ocellatum SAG 48.90 = DSM 106950]|nr:hypothetical protein [Stigonema ocellatum SAG 48.90 = DSM 106950]
MTTPLHGLILLSQDRLCNLVYIPSKSGYEVQEKVEIKALVKAQRYQLLPQMVALDDYIFIGLNEQKKSLLVRLDAPTSLLPQRSMGNSLSKSFGRIGAIGTDGEHLLIAAEGSLILLERNLEILDRVQLVTQNWLGSEKKNAHDIFVHENVVYLLENTTLSTFIFQVTINADKKLHITRTWEIQDVYPHLDRQWINPELGQWVVIQSSFGQGNYRQKAHIFPIAQGIERLGLQILYPVRNSTTPSSRGELESFKILNTTKISPAWAIISQIGESYLVKINSQNNRIQLDEKLPLEIAIRGDARNWLLQKQDNYIFILNSTQERSPGFLGWMKEQVSNILVIVDTQQNPQIILRQNLPFYNTSVLSCIPY